MPIPSSGADVVNLKADYADIRVLASELPLVEDSAWGTVYGALPKERNALSPPSYFE
jgi:hypothetical protein